MPTTFYFTLTGQQVDGNLYCCLGNQLLNIISRTERVLGSMIWYCDDVDTIDDSFCSDKSFFNIGLFAKSPVTTRLGFSEQFLDKLKTVNQFSKGVFLAVSPKLSNPKVPDAIYTESAIGTFLNDAVVAITMFNTSYFEILSNKQEVIAELAGLYDVEIKSIYV